MPKKTKKQKEEAKEFATRREIFSTPDSYKSLLYGIITVIILFIIGVGISQLFFSRPKAEIDDGAVSVSRINEAMNQAKSGYTVEDGETLWSIAEAEYGSGFEWYRLAEANKITDPTQLEKGMTISIPKEEATKSSAIAPTSQAPDDTTTIVASGSSIEAPQGDKISGDTYTVKRGDVLWDIAVRTYGDGYKWVEIAKANNLANPDLIFADNVLKLPKL